VLRAVRELLSPDGVIDSRAGFTSTDVLPIEHDIFRAYRLNQ
jgi:hypothetical protein